MPFTDLVSSITNCYRLIVCYTDPVHSFSSRNAQLSQLDLVFSYFVPAQSTKGNQSFLRTYPSLIVAWWIILLEFHKRLLTIECLFCAYSTVRCLSYYWVQTPQNDQRSIQNFFWATFLLWFLLWKHNWLNLKWNETFHRPTVLTKTMRNNNGNNSVGSNGNTILIRYL